uniref:Ubiquitin-like-conjugating enzyme ATG3 n=1 Tax=Sipha flava TaxID=143950 RepID=A0A2S2Q8Z9_9HEMI
MQNVINSVKGTALGVAGFLTPVLKETRFKETGVITPNEFVTAGDHLVHSCPTWEWACGDDCKIKSYLPKNKQYLITKNVPCLRRYKQVENCEIQENIVESEGGNEGWVETHHFDPLSLSEEISDLLITDDVGNDDQISNNASVENKNIRSYLADDDDDDSDEGEAMDMDAFVESGLLEDESVNFVVHSL